MHDPGPRVLVVNPGSTSTKSAVFKGGRTEFEVVLPRPELRAADSWEGFDHRLEGVRSWLERVGVGLGTVTAVVGRGGLLRPVEGGTYRVTERMLEDAKANLQGAHASNLGCALAAALAEEASLARRTEAIREARMNGGTGSAGTHAVPAFVVDPVSTDEMHALARYSGLQEIRRRGLSHALSIHALVRDACRAEGRGVKDSRFVVAHLGGGISICPVVAGKIIDATDANSGGPFSPSRAGGLPTQDLIGLAFSGAYSLEALREETLIRGGLRSYLGTRDAREVEGRIHEGDAGAKEVYEAMAYQISKSIGAMATVLKGQLDAVLLTGGLARSPLLTGWIAERVSFIAPVKVWPKVEEMRALAEGALRVLRGDEKAKEY
jgi:butyrate kinase